MDTLLLFCKGHCTIKRSIDDSLVPESMELELAFHSEDAPLALSGLPSLSWLCRAVLSERSGAGLLLFFSLFHKESGKVARAIERAFDPRLRTLLPGDKYRETFTL